MPATTKRVFLGFSLNAAQTEQITAVQAQLVDTVRLVPSANLHMTLAFLGAATPSQLQALIDSVDKMSKPTFSVTLDTLSHWSKPKIICLKGDASDNGLRQFAQDAQLIAAKLGLHCSEHSYNPHITLARKAKGEARTVVYHPICLQPLQLHLFESYPGTNGVEYPTLQHWDLA